jgi:hypothetical protein
VTSTQKNYSQPEMAYAEEQEQSPGYSISELTILIISLQVSTRRIVPGNASGCLTVPRHESQYITNVGSNHQVSGVDYRISVQRGFSFSTMLRQKRRVQSTNTMDYHLQSWQRRHGIQLNSDAYQDLLSIFGVNPDINRFSPLTELATLTNTAYAFEQSDLNPSDSTVVNEHLQIGAVSLVSSSWPVNTSVPVPDPGAYEWNQLGPNLQLTLLDDIPTSFSPGDAQLRLTESTQSPQSTSTESEQQKSISCTRCWKQRKAVPVCHSSIHLR